MSKAVVELKAGARKAKNSLANMIAFCRERIASYKCPKTVDFAVLPRLPNGKYAKTGAARALV